MTDLKDSSFGAVFYFISSSQPTKSNGSFTKFRDFKLQNRDNFTSGIYNYKDLKISDYNK